MALDNEFFDSISIDVVKKKYYNANKVHALLDDIRSQAAALIAENAALKEQLGRLNGQKSEIGDTLLSAQTIAKQIIERANAQAADIVRTAEKRRAELDAASSKQQEYAAKCVEECFAKVKRQHMECIETLNTEWQRFLCGLIPEDEEPDRQEESREDEEPTEDENVSADDGESSAPGAAEIEARIAQIAKELREIVGEE